MQKEKTVQHPPVTWRMKPREIKEVLCEFSERLKDESALGTKLKKPRWVALSHDDETIKMNQRKGHLPAQHEIVDGRRYARTYDSGNHASEALVRTNLYQFISETRRVVKGAIERQEVGLIVAMCRSYEDGIRIAGFFTAHETPLGKNRAFSEAITQFFKDERLILKIVMVALREQRQKPSLEIPVVGSVKS